MTIIFRIYIQLSQEHYNSSYFYVFDRIILYISHCISRELRYVFEVGVLSTLDDKYTICERFESITRRINYTDHTTVDITMRLSIKIANKDYSEPLDTIATTVYVADEFRGLITIRPKYTNILRH